MTNPGQGIIDLINMKTKSNEMRSNIMASLMMNKIKEQKAEEKWQRQQEYMNPWEKMMTTKFASENPEMTGEMSEMPGWMGQMGKEQKGKMQAAGQRGKQTTSQGVQVPSSYTPPTPDRTMKMGAKGPVQMSSQEQIKGQIMDKIKRNEYVSPEEMKVLGVDTKKTKFSQLTVKDRQDLRKEARETIAASKKLAVDLSPITVEEIGEMELKLAKAYFPNMQFDEKEVEELTGEGKTKMKTPDGRIGMIPNGNVDAAKQQGLTVVQ